MKTIKKLHTLLLVWLSLNGASAMAQCYQATSTSTNILSTFNNRTKQLIVNNALNTVVFIHRNDAALLGGDNGIFRYDISTDNGATWQINQGNLNPTSLVNVRGGRYPQMAIYNPTGNTNPSNAKVVYHGSVFNGNNWDSYVTGSAPIFGSTSTENYNQVGVSGTEIAGGMCQSTPGVFWAIDKKVDPTTFLIQGVRVLKGTYAGGDVTWSVGADLALDLNLDNFTVGFLSDWTINFDPSGQHGWIALLGHLNGSSDYTPHPIFFHSSDGGATWTGPVQLDVNSFSSITSLQSDPSCSQEIDLTVDANGHPHALVGVFKKANFPYGTDRNQFGNLYDFSYNGSTWSASHVGQLSMTQGFNSGGIFRNRPQMSRSDDGTRIVYTWSDSDLPSSLGQAYNLKAVTYDVATGRRSCAINYAIRCSSDLDGNMAITTVSPTMIEEGGVYTVPVMITTEDLSGPFPYPAKYYYLNDLTFTAADFTAIPPTTTLTITVSGQIPFCAGGSAQLTASSAGAYLWNTGETTQSITATGGTYWVVNPNDNYCISASNSIAAEAIPNPEIYTFNPTTTLCPNGTVDLIAFYYTEGNSILWSNGATDAEISVTTPGIYTVTVDGCTSEFPLEVIAGSIPSNDNLCNAQDLTIGVTTSFNNTCATVEANEPIPPTVPYVSNDQNGWYDDSFMGYANLDNTVWFSFIAPGSRAVNILVQGFDTQVALYSSSNGSCSGTMSLVAANDDYDFYDQSLINRAYCLERGKRYFIQVDGFFASQMQGTILVTAVPNTVTICHNQSATRTRTLTISGCGLADHLSHGDVIGTCSPLRLSASMEDDITSTSLSAYPNPAHDRLNISFDSDVQESYTLQMADVTGRIVSTTTGETVSGENKLELGLNDISTGLYFLILRKGDNVIQLRIVKE